MSSQTQHDLNNAKLVRELTTWLEERTTPRSPSCLEECHQDCPGWFWVGVHSICRCPCHPREYEP